MLARKCQDRSSSNTRFSATGRSSTPTIEKSSGYTALDISALRAVVGTRQILPLPGGVSQSHVDRSPQLRIPAVMLMLHRTFWTTTGRDSGGGVARPPAAPGGAADAAAKRPQRRPSAAIRQGRSRGSPSPISSRCHRWERQLPTRKPSTSRRRSHRCSRRTSNSSASSRCMPKDILNTIPAGDFDFRRAVRSLARGERGRRDYRHRAEDADRRSRRDAAVQRPRPPAELQPRVHRRGRPASDCSRIRWPTKSISSSARCAASRGRS